METPTLQEINDAINTLRSAGMLLNAEQSIIVNRVCRELKQQENDVFRSAEALRRQEQEAQRKAKENARRAEHERPMAKADYKQNKQQSQPQSISLNDLVPHRAIWNALNDRKLRTAYKKHLYASGMRGSMCTTRMADLSKKLKEIEENSQYKAMVQNCRTFAEMHSIFDSFLISWGDEKRFEWRKQFFHDFISFVQEQFVAEKNLSPSLHRNQQKRKDNENEVRELDNRPSLFDSLNEDSKANRRQIELTLFNGRKRTLGPFEALKYVILSIGCDKVAKLDIQVGRTRLLRKSEAIGSYNYINLQNGYWLQKRGTAYELYMNILKIIDSDNRRYIKDAQLLSQNDA